MSEHHSNTHCPPGYPDPFREGGGNDGGVDTADSISGGPHSMTGSAEGLFMPSQQGSEGSFLPPPGNIGSGPQSLSLSQGSIGGAGVGGVAGGAAAVLSSGASLGGGPLPSGLVKYESDATNLGQQQQHLPVQVSPTIPHHTRVHRRNVSDTSAFNK